MFRLSMIRSLLLALGFFKTVELLNISKKIHLDASNGKIRNVRSTCKDNEFQCSSGRCISHDSRCNGISNCINGEDETNCDDSLKLFQKIDGVTLQSNVVRKLSGLTADLCSTWCIKQKKFNCASFTFIDDKPSVCMFYKHNTSTHFVTSQHRSTYYERVSSVLEIRIVNRNAKVLNEGILEVRVNGDEWGLVCDDFWDINDAMVACRQLGFMHGALESHGGLISKSGASKFFMDNVKCVGNETLLMNCKSSVWGHHDCSSGEAAGVKCRIKLNECMDTEIQCKSNGQCLPLNFLCDGQKDCSDNSDELYDNCIEPLSVRLVGKGNSGRVELKRYGIWGTVCDDEFDNSDASVVCKMLGYKGPSFVLKEGSYPPGTGPIWLDNVNCNGNEDYIHQCTLLPWGQNDCRHAEDVSIKCLPTSTEEVSTIETPTAKTNSDQSYRSEQCGVRVFEPFKQYNGPGDYAKRDITNDVDSIVSDPESRDLSMRSYSLEQLEQMASELQRSGDGIVSRLARIVGGTDVNYGSAPWLAEIRVKTKSRSIHWCGAVIVSEHFVISAAHCLKAFPLTSYLVRIGEHNQEKIDVHQRDFEIERLIVPHDYNVGTKLNNDIAILKLKTIHGIKFNTFLQPICLPSPNEKYVSGELCEISGWGSTHVWRSSPILQSASIPILPIGTCKSDEIYGEDRITDTMFCAGYLDGGIDSCKGDSGGPFVCTRNGSHTLLGVISWGQGCALKNRPGVYVKVSKFVPWILRNIS
ncbi:SCRASP1 (predicted) [Pycnogonum litorale]